MRRGGRAALCVGVLGLAGGLARADHVGVPDLNPSVGIGCPSVPLAFEEARAQFQVHPSFLRPGRITEVSLVANSVGQFTSPDFTVTLAHNPNPMAICAFDANLVGPVVVHRGPITWNYASGGQWVPLRLQCAFDYNGVDELVVELRFRGGAGGPCLLGSATEPRATWATGPGSYDAPAATGCNARTGVKLRLTFTEVKLLGDPPAPGGSQAIVWNAPFDGGRGYLAAAALASAPGIALDCRTIPLALDPLLVLSLVDPVRFEGFQGALDFRGEANAALHVPPGPLSGVAVHLAFVVPAAGAPSGVRSVSGPQSFTIR